MSNLKLFYLLKNNNEYRNNNMIFKFSEYLLILTILISISGCVDIPDLGSNIDDTIDILDEAIYELSTANADWQDILEETRDKLIDETQSTIRNEVSNSMQRAISASGVEMRCGTDFLRTRALQDMKRIRAEFLNVQIEAPEPYICSREPATPIDMNLDPARRTHVIFYGYDFDTTPKPQSKLINNGNVEIDVSEDLHIDTHYTMTLNLGSNGVPLSSESDKLLIKWRDIELSDVPIAQPYLPECKTERIIIKPTTIEYMPPLVNDDNEFWGNGPHVTVRLTLTKQNHAVNANLYMVATEKDQDYNKISKAEGDVNYLLYPEDPGYRFTIEEIIGGLKSEYKYTDHDTSVDVNYPSGPVKKFEVTGDVYGPDIGIKTGVKATTKQIIVVVKQIENCEP